MLFKQQTAQSLLQVLSADADDSATPHRDVELPTAPATPCRPVMALTSRRDRSDGFRLLPGVGDRPDLCGSGRRPLEVTHARAQRGRALASEPTGRAPPKVGPIQFSRAD